MEELNYINDPEIKKFIQDNRELKLSDIALKSNTSGEEHIFIVTDANVMPQADTFLHLMKHFKNK